MRPGEEGPKAEQIGTVAAPAPRPAPVVAAGASDLAARVKRRLTPAMLVLALGFVAFAVHRLLGRWQATPVSVAPGWVLAAAAALAAGALAQARGWIALLEHMTGRRVDRRAAIELYFDSQLARYLPGKVGLPLVRMAGADRLGASARVVGVSVLVEVVAWCATGAGAGLALLVVGRRELTWFNATAGSALALLLAGAVVCLLLLVLVERRRWPWRLAERAGLQGDGPIVPSALSAWMLVHWTCWAVHGSLLCTGLGVGVREALAGSGYFVLAPIAGFLALAAPAGVGVREATIGVGLEPLLGAAPALVLALLSRVSSLGVDVLAWLGSRALRLVVDQRPSR